MGDGRAFERIKKYRKSNRIDMEKHDKEVFEKGYNQAIDDFVCRLCAEIDCFETTINGREIEVMTLDYVIGFALELAERLEK